MISSSEFRKPSDLVQDPKVRLAAGCTHATHKPKYPDSNLLAHYNCGPLVWRDKSPGSRRAPDRGWRLREWSWSLQVFGGHRDKREPDRYQSSPVDRHES